MRATAIAVLVLVLAVGSAVANPIVGEWFYVDFDPPNQVHRIDPELMTEFDVYVVLDLTASAMDGFTSISFRLGITPGTAVPVEFVSLLPGGVSSGDVWEGITLAATECVTSVPMPVARLTMLYNGIPGDIHIQDHPDYPRWIIDCQEPGQVVPYCVYASGGIGRDPDTAPLGDCGGNPVLEISWASIKALYR